MTQFHFLVTTLRLTTFLLVSRLRMKPISFNSFGELKVYSSLRIACSLLLSASIPMVDAQSLRAPSLFSVPLPKLETVHHFSTGKGTPTIGPNLLPIGIQSLYAALDKSLIGDMWIVLNNNAPREVAIDPSFYSANGLRIPGIRVVLAANEVRRISLNDLSLKPLKGEDIGSISLTFLGQNMQVGAQITTIPQNSLNEASIDFTFPVLAEFRSRYQDAVWWSPAGSTSSLFAVNISESPLTAILKVSNRPDEVIQLPPHGSRTITTGHSSQEISSAQFVLLGSSQGLISAGYATLRDGLRELISFSDPKAATSAKLFAVDLQLNGCQPHLLLSNRSKSLLKVKPRAFPLGRGHHVASLDLPDLRLEPSASIIVDLSTIKQSGLDSVNVMVESNGPNGSLNGSLLSVCSSQNANQAASYLRRSPLRDKGVIARSTGSYPVYLNGESSNKITIFNVSDQPQMLGAYLETGKSTYLLQSPLLKAGESVTYDPRQLQLQQTKDSAGHTINPGILTAKLRWSIVEMRPVNGKCGAAKLIGRSQITDVSRRVSSSFSCGITCPPGAYGPYFDFLGGSYTASALASSQVIWYYNDGYGNVTPFSSYANVISDNSAVALADDKGFGWLDTTAGILGSANLNYLYQSYENNFDGQDCYSSNSQQYPESAGMTVGPDIGPYSEDDIDSLEGALVGFDAINADGSISKASLDPEAYEYLVAQGFLDSGAVIRTIEVAIEQSQGAPPQYRVISSRYLWLLLLEPSLCTLGGLSHKMIRWSSGMREQSAV